LLLFPAKPEVETEVISDLKKLVPKERPAESARSGPTERAAELARSGQRRRVPRLSGGRINSLSLHRHHHHHYYHHHHLFLLDTVWDRHRRPGSSRKGQPWDRKGRRGGRVAATPLLGPFRDFPDLFLFLLLLLLLLLLILPVLLVVRLLLLCRPRRPR
jgi:hypothetical protein